MKEKNNNFYGSRTEKSKDNWETPQYLFELLDNEFHFDIDLAASNQNHLCKEYYTKENSGLKANCQGKTVFCNPPYDSLEIWIKKCFEESQKPHTTIVLLMPNRTDTQYFDKYCWNAYEIRIVKGRINFLINGKRPKRGGNNHPSLIVIFKKNNRKYPRFKPFYHREKDLIAKDCDIQKWI
jgi:phage N-6-adenine-methyltransferase